MANRPGDDRLEAAQSMHQAGIGSLSGRPLSPKFNYPNIHSQEERILNDYFDRRNTPGTGEIWPGRPEQGRGGIGEGSFWNVRADQAPIDNTGVMTAMSNNDQKRWIDKNPWLLSLIANRHGSPESLEYLEDAISSGGFDLWGGTLSPKWGNDGYGFNWKIPFGG